MGKCLSSAVVTLALSAGGVLAQSAPPMSPPGPLAPQGPSPEIKPSAPLAGGNPIPSLGSLGFEGPIFVPAAPSTPAD